MKSRSQNSLVHQFLELLLVNVTSCIVTVFWSYNSYYCINVCCINFVNFEEKNRKYDFIGFHVVSINVSHWPVLDPKKGNQIWMSKQK